MKLFRKMWELSRLLSWKMQLMIIVVFVVYAAMTQYVLDYRTKEGFDRLGGLFEQSLEKAAGKEGKQPASADKALRASAMEFRSACDAALWDVRVTSFWLFVICQIAANVVIWLVMRPVVRPIIKAARVADAIAHGNLDVSLDIKASGELDVLVKSMRQMAGNLKASMTEALETVNIFDSIGSPVVRLESDFTVKTINKAGAEMAGRTPAQCVGLKWAELFNPEDFGTDRCAFANAMRTGRPVTAKTVLDAQGKTVSVMYTCSPMRDKDGAIVGACGTITDISKIVETQKAVRSKSLSLGEAVRDLAGRGDAIEGKSTTISFNVNKVAVAAEQMSSTMATVSDAAEQAQASLNSVAASTEQMSNTVGEIASHAEKGRQITLGAVSSVETVVRKVDELGEASSQIKSVIDMIVEIAEQTKLLALNATIEAARAGEAGKGFAVVASEVKELASQTNNATADIRRKIEKIVGSTSDTVEKVKGIGGVINEVNNVVSTIAASVEEQSATTREIADNIAHAASGMDKIAANVSMTAKTSREVSNDIAAVKDGVFDISASVSQLNEEADKLVEIDGSLKALCESLTEETISGVAAG